MSITREFVRAVRGRLAQAPDMSTHLLALEFGVCETDVLTCLPVAMRRRARLEDQAAIRERLAAFGLPAGPDPYGPELGSIWFVAEVAAGSGRAASEPSGTATCPEGSGSLRFMDKDGELLCRVPLGDQFSPMWGIFGVKDTPPKRHCKGKGGAGKAHCGVCRCSRGLTCCGGHAAGKAGASRDAAAVA